MAERYKLLVVGGDGRQLWCAQTLADRFDVSVTGFEDGDITDEPGVTCASPFERGCYDCAVLPMNIDGDVLRSAMKLVKQDGLVIYGKAPLNSGELFASREAVSLLECEDFVIKNAALTAEGAMNIAMNELDCSLRGLCVLIAGMGRIGAALADMLKALGADVTVAVRNARGEARAYVSGVRSVRTEDIDGGYALVFNTVPEMIFDAERLGRLGCGTIIIDLASKPYGTDFAAADRLGVRAMTAPGLPAVYAPATAGKIAAETVSAVISERSVSYE